MARSTIKLGVFVAFSLLGLVSADYWGNGNGGRGWGGDGSPWWDGDDDDDDDDDDDGDDSFNSADPSNGFGLGSLENFNQANKVLIAHAVIASLVWVIFIPSGAILLRLGLKNPIVLKLHAGLQIISYLLFVVAAGMGIWLAQETAQFGTWDDPHPRLGLAILAIAFFQPIFGYLHHRIFKRRAADVQAGKPTKPPGRTTIGRVHLWVGRSLIVLGIINGGLGIRLASFSPFQTDSQSRTAKIVYSVVAAAMFAIYVLLVVVFEVRRKRAQNTTPAAPAVGTAHGENAMKLPSYDESQSEESIRRETTGDGNPTTRYS